jgi:glycosyltransferase involved in cell wall biosynthesis
MAAPLVTIITPCFKPGEFLSTCIEGVARLSQSGDVEHIVVDGGSGPETLSELRRLSEHHPHLQFLSEPDKGQSDALNKGVRLARGRWVGLLNVDDSYEPDLFKSLVPLLSKQPATSVHVGNCRLADATGHLIGINRPTATTWDQLILGEPWFDFPCNPCAYFYPRDIHEVIGDYDVGDHHTMDLDFLIRLSAVLPFEMHDQIWGTFVMHEDCKTVKLGQQQGIGVQKQNVRARHLHAASALTRARVALKRRLLQSRFSRLLAPEC